MNTITREVASARVAAAVPVSLTNVRLSVCRGKLGVKAQLLTPKCPLTDRESLHALARSVHTTIAARLPSPLCGCLTVEAGAVETTLVHRGHPGASNTERYVMASAHGILLGIGEPFSVTSAADAWSGTADPAEITPELPVVLGPSAALTIVSYALEMRDEVGHCGKPPRMPGLTVFDTSTSPYLPHDVRFSVLRGDAIPAARALVWDGSHRRTEPPNDVAMEFLLMTRPHDVFCALGRPNALRKRNLAIRCVRRVRRPLARLTIDGWCIRSTPCDGQTQFEAVCSLNDPVRGNLHVETPLRATCDPSRLLETIQGACGPSTGALSRDSIEGDYYGVAPPLLLSSTVGELLETSLPATGRN